MKETINRLSRELNLPAEEILNVYKAYWKFIRAKAEELPFKEDLDERTFSKLKTSFNIPKLGKLHCTYPRYNILKIVNKKIQDDKHKENQTIGQLPAGD